MKIAFPLYIMTLFIMVTLHLASQGQTYYIAENGKMTNNGTIEEPWPFNYLTRGNNHAGDTIIVRNGTYRGHWKTLIHGLPNKPVVIKSEKWMGAVIQGIDERTFHSGGSGKGSNKIVESHGSYTYWIDFRITDEPSNGNRIFNNGQKNYQSDGFNLYGKGSKVINCVANDVMIGFSMWSGAIGAELYGNIAYNIGWNNMNSSRKYKGHGHGYYIQNKKGVAIYKHMTNNVAWGTASEGLHLYTENGNIDYFDIGYNAIFNLIGYNQLAAPGRSFVLGGYVGANYLKFHNNIVFNSSTQLGYNLGPYLPYQKGLQKPFPDKQERFKGEAIHVAFDQNYLHGGFTMFYIRDFDSFSKNIFNSTKSEFAVIATRPVSKPDYIWNYPFKENSIFGGNRIGHQSSRIDGTNYYQPSDWGFSAKNFVSNTAPKDSVIFIQNKYAPERANVYVFNWSEKIFTQITLDAFAQIGDSLEIRDIQNIDQVLFSGTYKGGSKTFLPMVLNKIAPIKGNLPASHAKHTDRRFGSFIIINKSRENKAS